MKKLLLSLSILILISTYSFSQTFEGREAEAKIKGAKKVEFSNRSTHPEYVEFSESSTYRKGGLNPEEVIYTLFNFSNQDQLVAVKKTNDDLGFTHTRYKQYYKNIPVEGADYIAHERSGGLDCINGLLFKLNNISVIPSLSENEALKKALTYVGAKKYMWENIAHITELREAFNDPNFNFNPSGKLVIYPKNNEFIESADFRLAYKFNIYAVEPESRAYIYVDAKTGEIVGRQDLIHTADVQGSATTRYSGVRQITTDQVSSSSYRLRETGRGNGIQTMNAKKTTSTAGATDFTDTDNNWNNVNANMDEAATDAHWATEMTYDYFKNVHNRNSIDDKGFKLINYVHWDQNLFNAFWNGQYMAYGDGTGKGPLTAIDVGAHEMSHGLTSNTASLVYQGESGALNESFSDIFGACVESFAKGPTGVWTIGEDFQTIRNMKNPGAFSHPDTYNGTNWASTTGADNGGVHTNSGVQNKWFFILTDGESGTNDNGDAYTVTGIGIDKAAKIAFRNLTVYLTSNSNYASARTNALKSATDLYGNCSPEYIATADAWNAVGVGAKSGCSTAPIANFIASTTTSCDGSIQFTDKSTSAPTSWVWDFGDGQTASTQNPSHTYTSSGTFTVKLTATNSFGNNTATKTSYVTVNLMSAPTVTNGNRCDAGIVNLSASTSIGTLQWYDAVTGGNLVNTGATYSPNLNTTTTFYVEASTASPSQKLGPADTSMGTSAYFTASATHGLLFDVLTPCTIKSVKVYANTAGNRTIDVVSGGTTGTTIVKTTTVNVPAGESRITLNFDLTAGTQYFIKVSGSLIDLKRNSTGAVYPYTASGLISITNSSASSAGYYYYFYDWEIQAGSGCSSIRTPVTGTIDLLSKPTITLINTNELSVPAGYTYQWYLNGTIIIGATGQTYTVAQNGDYTVEITDPSGCKALSDPYSITAIGVEEVAALSSIKIYPNPSNGILYFNSSKKQNKVDVSVFSIIGKKIYSESFNTIEQNHKMDLSTFADGVYFIKLQIGSDCSTVKVTLQH